MNVPVVALIFADSLKAITHTLTLLMRGLAFHWPTSIGLMKKQETPENHWLELMAIMAMK